MIIHLISGPRNVSTALMYSFAQRPGIKVMDEPFYAFYLTYSKLEHPGREQVLATMEKDPEKVFARIHQQEQAFGNVFVKNMGHHLQGFNYQITKDFQNIFLIRDPGQMLRSYAKVREQPTLNDIGIQHQTDLFLWLQKEGKQPLVIDGNELCQNPAGVLEQLCERLQIPFSTDMLQWPAGPRPEDGCWAPFWYNNVHQSTGFHPPDPVVKSLPPDLKETHLAALPYYQYLKKHAITA